MTHGLTISEVTQLYAVVRANAFGLETALLAIEYGAAFYERACRFNHSCAPNCASIRIGGCMAIFAGKIVPAGAELCHSYLPPRMLIIPRGERAAHLHFACECPRCATEPEALPVAFAALHPPPSGALDAAKMAAFTLAMASNDQEMALKAAHAVVTDHATALREWPLGAIAVTAPAIGTYFASRLSASEDRDGGSMARCLDATRLRQARAMARLHAYATESVREAYEAYAAWARSHYPTHVSDTIASALRAAEMLADQSLIVACLLEPDYDLGDLDGGAPTSRERTTHGWRDRQLSGDAQSALRRLSARLGGGFDWVLDDLPCLSSHDDGPPKLLRDVLASACPASAREPSLRAAASAAGLALVQGLQAPPARLGHGRDGYGVKTAWAFIGQRPRACTLESLLACEP